MKRKRRIILPAVLVLVLLAGAFFLYTADYYRAEAPAIEALASGGSVTVTETDYGWFFDGPADADALIFYPGGKVEETAYAPLLHRLAAGGLDVCLVKMPFRTTTAAGSWGATPWGAPPRPCSPRSTRSRRG